MHKVILASTAENTSALRERFANSRVRTRQSCCLRCASGLRISKRLQAASKEAVIQSLKTVEGSTRDLGMFKKLLICRHRATWRNFFQRLNEKAAGRVVMDADSHLSDHSAATTKSAKDEDKGAHSASVFCRRLAKGARARGDKCSVSRNLEQSRAARARTLETRKIDGTSRVHHTVPGLPWLALRQPNATSASSDIATAWVAMLKNLLSPERSSDSGKVARLVAVAGAAGHAVRHLITLRMSLFAAREQHSKHLTVMFVSGAEIHLVCPAHKHLISSDEAAGTVAA